MKALVIGGTGPTGPFIVEGLLKRGFDTTIYHRGTHEIELSHSVKHIHGDPFSADLERDLEKLRFDVVISNYGRLRDNAQLMAGKCDRFIGVTSGAVYLGWGNPTHNPNGYLDTPCSEDAPLNNDVNLDKMGTRIAQGERVIMEKYAQGQYKATILRYPLVYGPHQLRSNIWPILKRILDGRKRIIIPGDGLQILSMGYAENCAHAMLLAIDNPKAVGQIYNVADEKCFSIHDFVKLIVEAVGVKLQLITVNHPRAFDVTRGYSRIPRHRLLNTAKISYELGYRDVVATSDAVKLCVAWSLANRKTETQLAEVLDDPYDYELEDKLIDAWEKMKQQLSDTLPSVPAKKHIKYEYGGNSVHKD